MMSVYAPISDLFKLLELPPNLSFKSFSSGLSSDAFNLIEVNTSFPKG